MSETAVLINRGEVSWECWCYLCRKCGADAFKADSLLLYVTRANPVTPVTNLRTEEEIP